MTRLARSAAPVELDPDRVVTRYGRWLGRQPLAQRTRDAYLAQVRAFVVWLAGSDRGGQALVEPRERDLAVRDYKRYVKTKKQWAPTSVNQALAAIDNFYRSMSVARPEVAREGLSQVAPRALEVAEQRAFLQAVERCPSVRDRAIATLFFYTGVRLSELAALEVADVSVSARRGRLRVRSGKGDAYREVPLNSACRAALEEWMIVRARQLSTLAVLDGVEGEMNALWLSRTGTQMGARAIDLVVRRLAKDAGLGLSAHVLRHTCVTNLIRSGADVVLVAEIAGHRRLDTTRRYSLPSEADRDAAVEAALVEL
jgi:site-specific recombinase XerD